jgi:hypothetical protein
MLALHENALIAALKARPGLQNTLREVGAIPNVPSEKLLAQYSTDAPAIYVAAPLLVVDNDMATMRFTLVIMVHNVGSRAQARKGNSQELGIDQYFTLACRTINGKKIGEATWYVKRAEFADDELFVQHGLTVMEVALESSAQELPYEVDENTTDLQLDDFKHLHADIDIAPHAMSGDYGKWLEQPPNYSTDAPDAQADIQLTGGSA